MALALLALLPGDATAYPRPGATERVSVGVGGAQSADPVNTAIGLSSWETAISGTGRYVAFSSTATNLVTGDTNGINDVFVRDRVARRTERVSVSSGGTQGVGACSPFQSGSFTPSISADGRYVSFTSCATNLVPGDANLAADVFVHDRTTRRTDRVSVSTEAAKASYNGSVSPDGRYVGFASAASDLVPGDTNNSTDGFVWDRATRKVQRVSVDSNEAQTASGSSGAPSLSAGARFAAFSSYASTLVPGDTNQAIDVFVRDLTKGTTERVSTRTGGGQTHVNGGAGLVASGGRAISADGRYVMFSSWASNLIPNDSNGTGINSAFDIFVHDRATRRTQRVSVGSDGHEANDDTSPGSLSLDGRYVVIASSANNLTPGDTGSNGSNTVTVGAQPGDEDVFLYDRAFGTTEMLSVAPDGTEAKGHCTVPNSVLSEGSSESFGPSVSADGQYVAFQSCASNLVPGDTNATQDEFVRYRGPHVGPGTVTAKGTTVSGWAAFSGAVLAATSDPANDGAAGAALGGGELVGGDLLYRPELGDLFLRLDLTQIPSAGVALGGISAPGDPRVLYGTRFVANGVAYEIRVHRAGVNSADPLNAAMGLFRCTEVVCTEIGPLRGGYGTTGEQIVVSVPLSMVSDGGAPLGEGGVLSSLRAYTAYGTYYGGPVQLLDEALLSRAAFVRVPAKTVTVTAGRTTVAAKLAGGSWSATVPRSSSVVVKACLGTECRATQAAVR